MQFDLFRNPIPQSRGAFPYVCVLPADVADTGSERLVAPLAPRAGMKVAVAGRLTPIIAHDGRDFILAVPQMTPLPVRMLGQPVGSIAVHRDAVTAALDYLFQGI